MSDIQRKAASADRTTAGIGRRQLLLAGMGGAALAVAHGHDAAARAAFQTGVGRQAPDAPASGAASVSSHRVEVPFPHGGVAAGHPLASMAGVRMLMQGGSAADAAVAAMAVLNVVEPWASGAAGNGFATCLDKKSGEVLSLAFTGAAPGLLDNQIDPSELNAGHKAVVTPGAFGGWIELARRFGRLPLSVLLEPAIGYARDDHPMDASISATIRRQQAALARYPTTAAIYLPGGQPPAPRSLFRNLPLARTFQSLADAESAALKAGGDRNAGLQAAYDYFYTGPIAQEMTRFSQAGGGWLRMKDMQDYRPRWQAPVSTSYRGVDVYCSPVTSRTGLEMCEQLNLLEGFDFAALPADGAQAVHLLAETIKVAKSDVYRYAADPASAPTPTETLISKAFADQRRRLINPQAAIAYPTGADLMNRSSGLRRRPRAASVPGDTTSLSVIDSEGNAIACTTTLGGGFGTLLVMGETGLICNNGLRVGSTAPYRDHPNFVAPGRIPLLGNCPVIVKDNGKLRMIFGTPGGETIGQTQFQTLVNVIDRGQSIQEAIEAPRIAIDADPGFYTPGAAIRLQMEARFPVETMAELKAMGHIVEPVGPYAIGSIQGILISADGQPMAGGDPRRMGYAVGY